MGNFRDEVIISISLIVSFIILAGTAILFIKSFRGKSHVTRRYMKQIPPLDILIMGVFLSLLVIFVFHNFRNEHNLVDAFLVACFNTVRVFLANEDISFLHELFKGKLPYVADVCNIYISFLYVLAPVLLLSFVLSFLEDLMSGIKYALLGHRNLHIFSDLNERSILLAEDIKRNPKNKRDLVIFTNVIDRNIEKIYEYARRADVIGAICFKKDMEDLQISLKSAKRKVRFFLLGEDETVNLQAGLALIEKFRNKLAVEIYIDSSKAEAEIMLDSVSKGDIAGKEVRVRRINVARKMIYQLLDERPLFINTRSKKISVLIVGAGEIGFEAIKAVSWCGQLEGFNLDIVVIDKDPELQKRFAKQCPELLLKDTYSINFITCDVGQEEFIKALEAHKDINYVIIALGNEEVNIQTAVDIRKFFTNYYLDEKPSNIREVTPLINVLISNPYQDSIVGTLKNSQKMSYNLLPFGDLRKLYKQETILDAYNESLALNVHYAYGADLKSFDNSEYNRRSSTSSAIHLKYKLFSVLGNLEHIDWTARSGEEVLTLYKKKLTKDRLEKLSIMEHQRWNAYMRSEGYVYAGKAEVEKFYRVVKKHYHALARKHPCLVEWEELGLVSEFVSELKGEKVDFMAEDRTIVSKLPEIYEKTISEEVHKWT